MMTGQLIPGWRWVDCVGLLGAAAAAMAALVIVRADPEEDAVDDFRDAIVG
jgi:hypothetical protein